MELTNNTLLITGGTSGIGHEMVRRLYQLNNQIIVVSGNQNKLNDLNSQFPRIRTLLCDLSNALSVNKLVEKCLTEHNQINILINNAGIQHNYIWTAEKDGYAKIEDEIRVNLTSPMKIIYGLLPLLTLKKSAAIVNISSGLAFAPKKTAPVYCATKSAIHIATKALRYQLEETNIKVFEIIPPLVNTPMTAGRGKGKISTRQLVDEFLLHFKHDRLEINIGKTKLLRLIQRIVPKLADHILKNA